MNSFTQGFKVAKKEYSSFLALVGLIIAVGLIANFLNTPRFISFEWLTIMGNLDLMEISAHVILLLFSPLFYLMAFNIYAKATEEPVLDQKESIPDSNSIESKKGFDSSLT